jgi:dihydropteroate synthase
MTTSHYRLEWGRHRLLLGHRTCIMGIINVTPDSFSDGGRFFDYEQAVAQGLRLAAEGADILDIGGESTRPYADPVPAAEEIRRVVPVIETLASQVDIPLSIDTTKAVVAHRALEAGAAIVNDISALRSDPEIANVIGDFDVPVVLMHMLGTPQTMQAAPQYDDLLADIISFLRTSIDHAVAQGIARHRIIIDPGIGFGKTFNHNLTLLNHLDAFACLEAPLLIGPSRKAFIRNLLKNPSQEDIAGSLPIVETGTQACVATAILKGAHIVRVHNVGQTVATVKIMDAVKEA